MPEKVSKYESECPVDYESNLKISSDKDEITNKEKESKELQSTPHSHKEKY